jgi:hypothetical protein
MDDWTAPGRHRPQTYNRGAGRRALSHRYQRPAQCRAVALTAGRCGGRNGRDRSGPTGPDRPRSPLVRCGHHAAGGVGGLRDARMALGMARGERRGPEQDASGGLRFIFIFGFPYRGPLQPSRPLKMYFLMHGTREDPLIRMGRRILGLYGFNAKMRSAAKELALMSWCLSMPDREMAVFGPVSPARDGLEIQRRRSAGGVARGCQATRKRAVAGAFQIAVVGHAFS